MILSLQLHMLVHALQESAVLCRIIPVVQFTQEVASFLRRLVKNLTIGITHSRLDAAPFCAAVVASNRDGGLVHVGSGASPLFQK